MMKYIFCYLTLVSVWSVQANRDAYWSANGYGHNVILGHHSYSRIEKPCPYLDVKCVQEFLKSRFGCSPVHGHRPEPYYENVMFLPLPIGNATAEVKDIQLFGLSSGEVKTFFINKDTDTMVLEIVFDRVLLKSPRTLITYYRKGQEPIKAEDYIAYEFRDFSLTWTYEGIQHRKPANSHVFAYMHDKYPKYNVSPKLLITDGHHNGLISNGNLSIREAMVRQAAVFMTAYLKSNVCSLQL